MSNAKLAENPEIDLEMHKPLERVNYEAGMLLGLEATRAEQAYHRQRVNRLQYWFQGAGTLLGLLVKMIPPNVFSDENNQSIRLVVTPGIAIDGLGRELLSYEPYCVNLRDWLQLQNNSFLNSGLHEVDGKKSVQLCITVRYQAASSGLQPVMTRKVNAGIDPVQPSRARDGILLEIIAGAPDQIPDSFYRAGLKIKPVDEDEALNLLTEDEKKYFEAQAGKKRQLKVLQTQLLYGLTDEVGALELKGAYDELARVLLASIEIPAEVVTAGDGTESIRLTLNPDKITLNNLIRPFVTTPDQLAWLAQEEMPS